MSTHPEMNTIAEAASETTAGSPQEDMAWMLQQFVSTVPDVTHAVLLSRDGLQLLDSGVDKDWADELSAAVSGLASLAANMTGLSHRKTPPRQIIIEREDCLYFVQSAGRSRAFEHYPSQRGVVDTLLVVVTAPDADAGNCGFEMARLLEKFAPYMLVSARRDADEEAR